MKFKESKSEFFLLPLLREFCKSVIWDEDKKFNCCPQEAFYKKKFRRLLSVLHTIRSIVNILKSNEYR